MKAKLILLFLLAATFFASGQTITGRHRTRAEAIEIAKKEFAGQDVDFYIDDSMRGGWAILVDAEPMKGWEHDCYLRNLRSKHC